MSGPLDEILKRLDAIERRLARLEAETPSRREQSEASNAADFGSVAPRADAQKPPVTHPSPTNEASTIALAATARTPAAPVTAPAKVAVGDEPKS